MTKANEDYFSAAMIVAKKCGVKTWEFREPKKESFRRRLFKTRVIETTVIEEGHAEPVRGHIVAPKPRDVRTLIIWCHECRHVARHLWSKPSYVQEYDATRFAVEELERRGFLIPAAELQRALAHVAQCIEMHLLSRLRLNWREIDKITEWLESRGFDRSFVFDLESETTEWVDQPELGLFGWIENQNPGQRMAAADQGS